MAFCISFLHGVRGVLFGFIFFFSPSKQGQKSRMNFLTEVPEFGAFGEKNAILARKEKFCNYQESH